MFTVCITRLTFTVCTHSLYTPLLLTHFEMSTQITPDTRRFATLLQRGYVGFTRIGTGAQANVYRTQKGNRVLAIKVTKVEDEDDIGEDIQQELTIARNIVHPNCIRVEEMFRSMHRIYQVMPYMANGTIAHIIDKGPLSEWNVIVWFPYIARAIKYLHSCSIAHRDLHANNILLDAHLNPIVSDFGLAKFVESDPANPGQSIQSTQFWSQLCNHHGPELVIGIPYDMLKEDVWSLGVMLFLMINQDYPFDSDAGRVAMAQKQLNRDYRLKPTIEAEVRAELKDLIRQMLEPVQDNRPNIEQVCAHKWMPLITRENELTKK